MTIEAGQPLLHYHLIEKIGEGGMGVVWKAVDDDLDREVAIKILPAAFADNPERLARFEREAKLLASLNHPNLATVFGVHVSDSTRFLAMELVPGEDLAQRLKRGRIPVDETIRLARQVAEGLEAAHARGVIHRDLKPANVHVAPGGAVKILDFGLAKTTATRADPHSDPELSPTITSVGSVAGLLLGTAAYMSPEQARGHDVDERSDIWSFGCLVWECLTGQKVFEGPTASDSIGAILKSEPNWDKLPADTPPAVRRLLRRCLAKDPRERLHHVADARIELADSTDLPPPVAQRSTRPYKITVALLSVALLASLAAVLWTASRLTTSGEAPPGGNPLAGARFSKLTDFEGSQYDAAISPDGRFVTFVSDRDGPFEILVGQVGTGDFQSLTQRGKEFMMEDARAPVRSVGFNYDGSEIWLGGGPWRRVRTMPLLGGPARNFLTEDSVTVAWSPAGDRIVFHERVAGDPLFVADHDGTNSREILAPPAGVHQHYPIWSVDGEWIYLSRGRPTTREMDLWRVRPDGEGLEQLTRQKLDVRYPTPVDERTVLYSARDADGAGPWLWSVDVETGVSRRASVGLEQYGSLSASADGLRLVATVQDPSAQLWSIPILDRMVTESDAEPLADLATARALAPRFGGSSMFYLSSHGSGDGLWRYDEGEVEEIWKGNETALLEPAAVSPDGDSVVLLLRRDEGWRLHLLSSDGAQRSLLSAELDARGSAAWSPDGQWIVAGGSVAGEQGLFKIPLAGGTPQRIADGEATNPVWSPDGKLIVYAGPQVNVRSALLAVDPEGSPVELPEIEVFRDGERMRFLPDGSGLVYMNARGPSQDFWLLDLGTMQSRQLTRLDPGATMRTFDVTPGGRRIVFDRLSLDSDVVLIERRP